MTKGRTQQMLVDHRVDPGIFFFHLNIDLDEREISNINGTADTNTNHGVVNFKCVGPWWREV